MLREFNIINSVALAFMMYRLGAPVVFEGRMRDDNPSVLYIFLFILFIILFYLLDIYNIYSVYNMRLCVIVCV